MNNECLDSGICRASDTLAYHARWRHRTYRINPEYPASGTPRGGIYPSAKKRRRLHVLVSRSPSGQSPQPTSSVTRTQRVLGRRPVSAGRRPPPPPSIEDAVDSRAGIRASQLVALSSLAPAALGGKLASASVAPRGRSPSIFIALAGVHNRGCCFHLRRPRSCEGNASLHCLKGIPQVWGDNGTSFRLSCLRDKGGAG